jgi:hypothetical protein
MSGRTSRQLVVAACCSLVVATALTGCKSSAKASSSGGGGSASAGSSVTPSAAGSSSSSSSSSSGSVQTSHTKGCDLITRSEAEKVVGAPLGAGHTDPAHLDSKIVAHTGCGYRGSGVVLAFDANTLAASIPVQSYAATGFAQLKARVPSAKQISVNGDPGFSASVPGVNLQDVSFYHGQIAVIISVEGKPGAALAAAKIIQSRL